MNRMRNCCCGKPLVSSICKARPVNVAIKNCCDNDKYNNGCSCGFDEYDNGLPTNPILAQAYVPIQHIGETYCPEEALKMGTLFPELVRPYVPYQSIAEDTFIKSQNIYFRGGCPNGYM